MEGSWYQHQHRLVLDAMSETRFFETHMSSPMFCGFWGWKLGGKKVSKENLKIAFPLLQDKELNHIIQKTYKFFVHNLIEFCAFPASIDEIIIEIEGKNHIEEGLKRNNGLILVSGHFGSWEVLGNWIGRNFPIFTGVAIKQKNLGAHKFFIEQRELSGTRHIFKKDSLNKIWGFISSSVRYSILLITISKYFCRNVGVSSKSGAIGINIKQASLFLGAMERSL